MHKDKKKSTTEKKFWTTDNDPRKQAGTTIKTVVILLLVGFALASASLAEAQQAKKIGYLAPVFPYSGTVPSFEAFRQGLRALGYVEGQHVVIECRSAGGKADRLSEVAAELVGLKVDVIIALEEN